MLLIQVHETELRIADVGDSVVLIMKKGQVGLSMPMSLDQLDKMIKDIRTVQFKISEKINITRSAKREQVRNKYGDKHDI